MEKKVTYKLNGILSMASGEVVHIDKKSGAETCHDLKGLLEKLDGKEVKISISHVEDTEEDQ